MNFLLDVFSQPRKKKGNLLRKDQKKKSNIKEFFFCLKMDANFLRNKQYFKTNYSRYIIFPLKWLTELTLRDYFWFSAINRSIYIRSALKKEGKAKAVGDISLTRS